MILLILITAVWIQAVPFVSFFSDHFAKSFRSTYARGLSVWIQAVPFLDSSQIILLNHFFAPLRPDLNTVIQSNLQSSSLVSFSLFTFAFTFHLLGLVQPTLSSIWVYWISLWLLCSHRQSPVPQVLSLWVSQHNHYTFLLSSHILSWILNTSLSNIILPNLPISWSL